jgi:hypothetical protein
VVVVVLLLLVLLLLPLLAVYQHVVNACNTHTQQNLHQLQQLSRLSCNK